MGSIFEPFGTEFTVNPDSAGQQMAPHIVTLTNGDYLVTWDGYQGNTPPGSNENIYAQRFNADGQAVGNQFLLSSGNELAQHASVTALPNGGFVATWAVYDVPGAPGVTHIAAQIFDASNHPVGSEFKVNSLTSVNDAYPDVVALAGGGFVISYDIAGNFQSDVYARIYDANGVATGQEFMVNTTQAGWQSGERLIPLTGGGFVVAWVNDNVTYNLVGQRYDAHGAKLGGEFQISPANAGPHNLSALTALPDGGFIVGYSDATAGASGSFLQRYDASGVPVGSRMPSSFAVSDITVLKDGSYLATGTIFDPYPSMSNIYAQHYAADGTPIGGLIAVNTTTNDQQQDPAVGVSHEGDIFVAWQSYDQGSNSWDVFAQRYATDVHAIEQTPFDLKHVISIGDDTSSSSETVTLSVDYGLLQVSAGTSGATVTGSGTSAVTVTGTVAQINALLGSDATSAVGYVANTDTPPATATLTLSVTDADHQTATKTVPIRIMPVDDAAVAHDDSFTTAENAKIIAGNLFADHGHGADNYVDGPALAVGAVNGIAANVGADVTLASGAHVTVHADGTFDYDPHHAFDSLPAAASGASITSATDSFTYTLVNGSTATVTLTIKGVDSDDLLVGTTGDDVLSGGIGNDTYIVGNTGDKVIEAINAGIDEIRSSVSYTLPDNVENLTLTGTSAQNAIGNALDNHITGNAANNYIDGGAGVDDMTGGLGEDTYYIDTANDVIHENANEGYDTEIGSVAFVLADNVEHGILSGTNGINLFGNGGDNWLTGNDGANTLYGLGGNDRLEGGAGADTLIGGLGDDTYVWDGVDTIVENAGEGNDTVESATTVSLATFANIENLTLTGNAAINATGDANANVLRGNAAANTLDGGAGADMMYGGAGDDTYIVDNAGDKVFENANEGTDTVRSSVTFTLGANVENLVLTGTGNINGYGNAGANTITGNAGSNTLDGGGGGDTLAGGAGNDVYYIRSAADVIVEGAGEGTLDTALSSVSYTLGANAQVERLAASDASLTTAINLTGNAYSHLIQGNAGVNVLTGGSGNDSLFGYAGDDRLDGGQGADTLTGGIGNDTYVVDNAGDVVVENANEGTDTVESSISYTLGANVENLTLTGGSAIDGTGNAGANVIRGNAAANTLNGGGGADMLYGGGGNDTYVVDNAGVQIVENAGEGTDTVRSSLSYTLGANLENLVLTGTGNINGYGNSAQNMITGNAGNNVLDGAGGGDTLQGGAGNDVYYVRSAADVIVEGAGQGTVDTVLASVSYTLNADAQVERLAGADANLTNAINLTGNAYSHLIQGNAGVNTLTGGTGNDNLYGYAGDDRLDGGQGTDTLYGGIGNDTYVVDSQSDVIVENANEGTDTVETAITYSLAAIANVENLTLTGTNAINGTGNALDNVIHGNSAANTLNGGGGTDMLYGGAGDDIYVIGDAHAKVIELAGEGNDTVQASISYSLAGMSNIETLMLTGTAFSATGNGEHNILIGTASSNVLDGGGGGDTLQGGAGNDVYYIRNAGDVIVEGAGEGAADTVLATVSYTLNAGAQVERLAASDANTTNAINLTGNDFSHTIQGNNGANVLTGGSGADTLFGYGGSDTLSGGGGADKFVFAHGTGQDTIGDFVAGTDKIDLTAIGFASYQDVINATHDVGGNAVIDLGNGDQVTLTGVTTAQLHSGDFIGAGNSAAAVQMQPFALSVGMVDTWHGGVETVSVLHG
jgi:Ca2+-binding RTX toxin-like protein